MRGWVQVRAARQDMVARATAEHRGVGDEMARDRVMVMVPSGAMGGQW